MTATRIDNDWKTKSDALTLGGIVIVTTPLGYVLAQEGETTGGDVTWFFGVSRGREYVRRAPGHFTKRGLITVAGRFAREIASAKRRTR